MEILLKVLSHFAPAVTLVLFEIFKSALNTVNFFKEISVRSFL